MDIDYKLDDKPIVPRNLAALLNRNIKKAINGTFMEAREIVRGRVPRNRNDRHSERLYETVRLDLAKVSTHSARLWTENPIWPLFDEDTDPHIIEPKDPKGVLAFQSKTGELIFTRRVEHPGTKGHHYWDEARDYIDQNIGVAVDRAFQSALAGAELTGSAGGGLTG